MLAALVRSINLIKPRDAVRIFGDGLAQGVRACGVRLHQIHGVERPDLRLAALPVGVALDIAQQFSFIRR